MKHLLLTLFLISISFFSMAAPGDTTIVRSHDHAELDWYGRYKGWAVFPSGKTFHRVNLDFTLGCGSGGCSDWDYTVTSYLLRPTGTYDSTVASIDTISTNPLLIDTTWNVFEVKERLELARLITPYGGYMRQGQAGYSNAWEHTLRYDVTDMQMLMEDSVEIEVFFSGWPQSGRGFSATLDFVMIEGTPARDIVSIDRVWTSTGGAYTNPVQFDTTKFPERQVTLDPQAQGAFIRITPTGHGFVNSLNCAEFCQKKYFLDVNGTQIAAVNMWRDDCGLNPVYPQGGTWLYDRANWCPGAKAWWYDHDLTPHFTGSSFSIDFQIEPYTYTVPSGQTPATYQISNLLFQTGAINFTNDVELEEVLAPSDFADHGRLNPVCGRALVRIRNKGSDALTSCTIVYQVEGGIWSTYQWSGNLDFMESEIVELPMADPDIWLSWTGVKKFHVRAKLPNGKSDENPVNDWGHSSFDITPQYPSNFYLELRTNANGGDTWWELMDASGSVLYSGDNLAAYTTYTDTFDLQTGCYELVIHDRSKNGLNFWANNDGAGRVRLRDGGSFFQNMNTDFGTELRIPFTVGFGIGLSENEKAPRPEIFP
ncbi:MAG: hypothetical protein LPK46_04050, partial [Bacteroidota bacterium]|nr:hypothetical protein [Bacteroidota bacterium]MDX5505292.1 hypothetical protein [Bacteroidota bacterium]